MKASNATRQRPVILRFQQLSASGAPALIKLAGNELSRWARSLR